MPRYWPANLIVCWCTTADKCPHCRVAAAKATSDRTFQANFGPAKHSTEAAGQKWRKQGALI